MTTKTEWVVQWLNESDWCCYKGPMDSESLAKGVIGNIRIAYPNHKFRLIQRTTTTTIEERVIE